MLDDGGLAVHEPSGAHLFVSKHFHYGLVPEAHTQHRQATGEGPDHIHGYAGIVRRAGTRRDTQVGWSKGNGLLHRYRNDAIDVCISAAYQKRLHEVVGKGIVIVDQQLARSHNPVPPACSSARTMAALFASTSSCSG